MTGIQEAYERLKTLTAIGVLYEPPLSAEAVRQWLEAGIVPWRRCRRLSDVSGVPVERLNPEFYGHAKAINDAPQQS